MTLPAGLAAAQSRAIAAPKSGRPKNIIFCVSDGMSPGVLMMAEYFSKIVRNKGTRWAALMDDPQAVRAVQDVASLDSPVTDSSSSSSAWGSGSRIFNGAVNVLPDGAKLTPILQLAKDTRRKTALLTTATVTHATPAGFAAIQLSRDDEDQIALQYQGKVDYVFGGGQRFFLPTRRKDKRDVTGDYAKAGYQVLLTRKDFLAADPKKKALGLFSDSHMPYTIDKADVPTLAEMTQWTLNALAADSPAGFVMQIEGAHVDHAAHANDIAAQLWDQLAFDDALGIALDFAAKRGDTLVITTSDHGNSSPGLNGMGNEYRESGPCFERIAKAKGSFDTLVRQYGPKPTAARLREVLAAERGVEISAEEAKALEAARAGKRGINLIQIQDKPDGVQGQILSNHYGVAYTGMNHTSEYTMLSAIGPGAAPFEGFVVNTDIFPVLTGYLGIKHKNPAMTAEAARKFIKPEAADETKATNRRG